jgi:TPP-dependent pyruvate/acetoin dehydrogenase alpha subunit
MYSISKLNKTIPMEEVMKYAKEQLLVFYREMQRIRQFEEAAIVLWDANMIKGSIHPYLGQEAIASAVCQQLKNDDYIVSTHRGHGHCLAKGADPGAMMGELLGKTTGCCKGRGGSMHIADVSTRNLGANGIVAGGLGLGVGAALTSKLKNMGYVVVAFFGEGATGEGMFHEALNMAAIWKLPVVFICENNRYSVSTCCDYSVPVKKVSDRAKAYGMPGVTIDGNEIRTVYETAGKYIEKARNGEGPAFIECITYRWEGHYHGEPQVYRTKEEIEEWKRECPILRFEQVLKEEYKVSAEELDEIKQAAVKEMEDAVRFAKESPDPVPETVFDYVYAE